jgi:hypothetical protein
VRRKACSVRGLSKLFLCCDSLVFADDIVHLVTNELVRISAFEREGEKGVFCT